MTDRDIQETFYNRDVEDPGGEEVLEDDEFRKQLTPTGSGPKTENQQPSEDDKAMPKKFNKTIYASQAEVPPGR